MRYEILGKIGAVETIAVGKQIRELTKLFKLYGKGRWRKRKGVALVRTPGGRVIRAEVHWYEAAGIGRRALKVKKELE